MNSEVGKGTIFTTTLRLMRHESEPESEIDEQWHNPRTLMVRQDQDHIHRLESCLATWQIAAETISTPEITSTTVLHPLNRAAKTGNSYGLVIVDEASAKIEVLKFAWSVRMEPGCDKLKLILLTTEKNQIFSRLAIEAGFNRTITTPFQQSLLFNYLSVQVSLNGLANAYYGWD
ncbi:MAG: hypothetical protein NT075_23530 [Chloroflexi bacterium]|nr:hypothetical protein [Chloroflexota bacterium]